MSSGIDMFADWESALSFTQDGTWQTVDLSSILTAGSTGVVLWIGNSSGSNKDIGAQKAGGTDDFIGILSTAGWSQLIVGVNGDREVELYASGSVNFHVAGEVDSDGSFNTDSEDVTPGTSGSFQTVAPTVLTSTPTAAFLMWEHVSGAGATTCNDQSTASTDDLTSTRDISAELELRGSVVKLINTDFEAFIEHSGPDRAVLHYMGDINAGVTMFDDVIDHSQTTTGAFTDDDFTDDTAADATGVVLECPNTNTTSDRQQIWRENGNTDDLSAQGDIPNACMNVMLVGVDSAEIAEFFIEDTSQDSFLKGYMSPSAVITVADAPLGTRIF